MTTTTKQQTAKQISRQRTRKDGRYSTMNACEYCGKGCGAEYYSAANCNETGKGLVLHEKCVEKFEAAQ